MANLPEPPIKSPVLKRYYYAATISNFIKSSEQEILGALAEGNEFSLEITQRGAWQKEIRILKEVLTDYEGHIYFEYSVPRMGHRIDVTLVIANAIFVLEFKIGEKQFLSSAIEQVWNYALDLKNFHQPSHEALIVPVLIATEAKDALFAIASTSHNDNLLYPIKATPYLLSDVIKQVLEYADGENIDAEKWATGRYEPTPTIIEAATALYNNHSVLEISRSDASATNLSDTSSTLSNIIQQSKNKSEKAICFVTGVPGAGKTLVGLDIATKHLDKDKQMTSVFLSGNGPLVAVLREALARDKVLREKEKGKKIGKGEARSEVKTFIQPVHHFRDECLKDEERAPFDHVAIFDEAQRAWNHQQTASFMSRKKGKHDFAYSEPEFLISCLNRHKDWAVVVCLVGGGQEINTGEAGISEWIASILRSFPDWRVYISPQLADSEYSSGNALKELEQHQHVVTKKELHLSVSLRSFRAENLSLLVKNIIDQHLPAAQHNYALLKDKYPIVLTRDLAKAKKWLKEQARASERYGMLVSSQALRLKPHAIDVRSPMDPVNWFLESREDVRSSYYLEDVATEFHVQGLELDWSCVTWDGDFRYTENGWQHFSFVGSKWQNINKEERKQYLKNAYRVLLTRARQGMVIVVPEGDKEDPTRSSTYYDGTYEYLRMVGIKQL